MINKIRVINKFATLDTNFLWENVPKFSIIAGINGAGKTKFLNAIYEELHNRGQGKSIILDPKAELIGKVKYLGSHHGFGNLYTNQNNGTPHSGSRQHCESLYTQILTFIKNGLYENHPWENLIKEISDRALVNIKALKNLADEKIVSAIPPNAVSYIEDGFANQHMATVFKAYLDKMDYVVLQNAKNKKFLEENEIIEIIGFAPPWKAINDSFSKYNNFIYRIDEPKTGLDYTPTFKAIDGTESISFVELSSGEKIIVSLILWGYNQQLSHQNKLFLMDEFDAHLNPSMSKMLIDILKEKIVGEFGIQVIMTTHSPSTVAHTPDENLFWMERGQNIRKSSKREIIPILSDGIMTYQEAGGLLETVINSNKPVILFTEGITDTMHLETAKEKLKINDSFDIFPCGDSISGGADKLKQFLISCPAKLFEEKIIIGLFDYDEEGLKQKKHFDQIDKNIFLSRSNPKVYAIFLPAPDVNYEKYENCPIEFLYYKDIIEKYDLLAGKRSISEINKKYFVDSPCNSSDYEEMNYLWFYKLNDSKKILFTKEINGLNADQFINFVPIFDIINEITKQHKPTTQEQVQNEPA